MKDKLITVAQASEIAGVSMFGKIKIERCGT